MSHVFSEVTIGDVLVAPFVGYAAVAVALFLLLRPVLRQVGFDRVFSNPPIANLCLLTIILAFLMTLF